MSQPVHDARYSFADYVAFERTSNVKHEFLAGQIYAMAGGTPEHAALTAAVSGLLFTQLRNGECRVYSSDLRVRADDLVTYPDITVVCGAIKADPADSNTVLNPTLVVEVTSSSTEEYDRKQKLQRYQNVLALRSILIISHRERRVDRYERSSGGWEHGTFATGQTVELNAVGATLLVDDIYAGPALGT